jgi:DNA-binding HxlR family transcriptional regulator
MRPMSSLHIHCFPIETIVVTQSGQVSEPGKDEEATRARAGATMLLIASEPENRSVLREVSDGPIEWSRDRIARILPSGEEILFIAFTIEQWLRKAPGGPIGIEGEAAGRAIPALAEGWSSTVVHALAARPRTAAELEDEVEGVGAARLRRLLEAMVEVGLLEERPDGADEARRYAVTDFLRAGMAPIAVGARFEQRYVPAGTPRLDVLDVEAGMRLALPLLRLAPGVEGVCRLGVSVVVDARSVSVGAMARVERGRVVSVSTELSGEFDALLEGPTTAWIDAAVEPLASRLLPEGDEDLAAAVLAGLHDVLFGVRVR